jgi:hypothetical protein
MAKWPELQSPAEAEEFVIDMKVQGAEYGIFLDLMKM